MGEFDPVVSVAAVRVLLLVGQVLVVIGVGVGHAVQEI